MKNFYRVPNESADVIDPRVKTWHITMLSVNLIIFVIRMKSLIHIPIYRLYAFNDSEFSIRMVSTCVLSSCEGLQAADIAMLTVVPWSILM